MTATNFVHSEEIPPVAEWITCGVWYRVWRTEDNANILIAVKADDKLMHAATLQITPRHTNSCIISATPEGG